MRIVVASDSFKGSLTSGRIIEIVREVAAELSDAEVVGVPMADGGEGTVDAVVAGVGGQLRSARVAGPLQETVTARWGLLPGDAAVIEMAAASGLPLVGDRRDVMAASSRGTGELIMAALDSGARSVTLAIGGSATNDGGMGCLCALGVRFLDEAGDELSGCGAQLSRVASVDVSGLDKRLASGAVDLTVMCDVDNPLLGPQGAAAVFAPQKGADPAMVRVLEAGMASYAEVVALALGLDLSKAAGMPGAGAAGGLGFALSAFVGARMVPGVEVVLDLVGFDGLLEGADLVITGEGRLDSQTAHGKVVSGVASRAARSGVACVAIVGSIDPATDPEALGLARALATAPRDLPLAEAMARADELYADAARDLLAALCTS